MVDFPASHVSLQGVEYFSWDGAIFLAAHGLFGIGLQLTTLSVPLFVQLKIPAVKKKSPAARNKKNEVSIYEQ